MLNRLRPQIFQRLINLFWHLPQSILYSFFYRFPARRLTLIGVTGTDGKTTTASLIYETMTAAGIRCGLISTIGAKIDGQNIFTGFHTTSPDPATIQKLLHQMIKSGATHAVLEVTSHALDQYRYWGCHFAISVLTNTSNEHLDYHRNMTDYVLTKAKLFHHSRLSILNRDDDSYSLISPSLSTPIQSYSIKHPSNFHAKKVTLDYHHLTFEVNRQKIITDSNYIYQVYNILATLAVITALGIDSKYLLNLVQHFPTMKGRREEIVNQLGIRTIIDFAHTPAALSTTLRSLKIVTPGKLIVIFGATGGRDRSKRPLMGRVVSRIADIAIITADDTRNEKIENINQEIISGISPTKPIKKRFTFYNIANRQDAFNLAIKLAKKGDTVIACGKGHETTILHGQTEYPWSEAEAFRTAFNAKHV